MNGLMKRTSKISSQEYGRRIEATDGGMDERHSTETEESRDDHLSSDHSTNLGGPEQEAVVLKRLFERYQSPSWRSADCPSIRQYFRNDDNAQDSLGSIVYAETLSARVVSSTPFDSILDSLDCAVQPLKASCRQDDDSIVCELEMHILDFLSNGDSKRAANLVTSAMRSNQGSNTIHVYCLSKIWYLCKINDVFKALYVRESAPDIILRSMKTHWSSALIQHRGCRAIWMLATDDEGRGMACRAGAPARILHALLEYQQDRDVSRASLGALRALSPDPEARRVFETLWAATRVSEAMLVHRSDGAIQRDGCAFLSNVSVNAEQSHVSIATPKELDAIVHAITEHQENGAVLASACRALKIYAHDERNIRTLRECEHAIGALQDVVESVFATSDVKEDASNVLCRLQITFAQDESLEDQALKSLLGYAHNSSDRPNSTRHIVSTMNEYAWSAKVSCGGLDCLAKLAAQSPSHRSRMRGAALRDSIGMMERHVSDAAVQRNGAQLLGVLAEHDEDDRRRVIEARGSSVLIRAMREHSNDQDVIAPVLSALCILTSDVESSLERELEGSIDQVSASVYSYESSETVNQCLCHPPDKLVYP